MADFLIPLIGAWILVSMETQLSDGRVINAFSDEPKGIIVYTSSGHMSAQLSHPVRSMVDSNQQKEATDKEIRTNYENYITYHGTYELNEAEGMVTHFVDGSLFSNWEGGAQKRLYELNGNKISLTTPEVQWGDLGTVKTTLVWEKLN